MVMTFASSKGPCELSSLLAFINLYITFTFPEVHELFEPERLRLTTQALRLPGGSTGVTLHRARGGKRSVSDNAVQASSALHGTDESCKIINDFFFSRRECILESFFFNFSVL